MTLDTAQYKRMYQRISAIEFSILRIGEYPIPSIINIVNIIRLAKGNVFAEWKQSDTAKLFEDHGYKNKKSKQEATFSKQKNKGLALPIPLSVSFIVQYDSI